MITDKDFDPRTGILTTWHTHPDTGEQVEQKTFDATPFIESASLIRREIVQKGSLRHAFRFPAAFVYHLRSTGELGEEAFVNGQLVIDMKSAEKLIKKYPAFACVDKL
jgi:hypothetical protein